MPAAASTYADGQWPQWKDDLLVAVAMARDGACDRRTVGELANGTAHVPGPQESVDPGDPTQGMADAFEFAWSESQNDASPIATISEFEALALALYDDLGTNGNSIDSTRARGRGGAV
jgi:hypothetical protein